MPPRNKEGRWGTNDLSLQQGLTGAEQVIFCNATIIEKQTQSDRKLVDLQTIEQS